jgi:hypothetical protein
MAFHDASLMDTRKGSTGFPVALLDDDLVPEVGIEPTLSQGKGDFESQTLGSARQREN